ncbi:MAG: DUF2927 domain-containing protein [Chitinophagales bacterium]
MLTYFMEVALNYPSVNTTHIVKWNTDIHIAVHGEPSPNDLENLRQLTDQLNLLIAPIHISLDKSEPNMHVFFGSPQKFQESEPYFKDAQNPILNGVTFVYHHPNYEIYKANILISSRTTNSEKRAHTIREEITQSLGLLTDSWKYENSIFYEGQSYTTRFSEMDEGLIQLLYTSKATAGMNAKDLLHHLCPDFH